MADACAVIDCPFRAMMIRCGNRRFCGHRVIASRGFHVCSMLAMLHIFLDRPCYRLVAGKRALEREGPDQNGNQPMTRGNPGWHFRDKISKTHSTATRQGRCSIHAHQIMTLPASAVSLASSSIVLRRLPWSKSASVIPRASMQVPHSRTSPLP